MHGNLEKRSSKVNDEWQEMITILIYSMHTVCKCRNTTLYPISTCSYYITLNLKNNPVTIICQYQWIILHTLPHIVFLVTLLFWRGCGLKSALCAHKEGLYHLTHTSHTFSVVILEMGVSWTICLGWPLNLRPPNSTDYKYELLCLAPSNTFFLYFL
jgi:hypothetical protein